MSQWFPLLFGAGIWGFVLEPLIHQVAIGQKSKGTGRDWNSNLCQKRKCVSGSLQSSQKEIIFTKISNAKIVFKREFHSFRDSVFSVIDLFSRLPTEKFREILQDPWKTNIEPKKRGLENQNHVPLQFCDVFASMLIFRGVSGLFEDSQWVVF